MNGYLGEFPLAVNDGPIGWALHFIGRYGGIDGAHHKDWVLDQVARILNGTPVIVTEARWGDGETEMRARIGDPSQKYEDWVRRMKAGEDGPETFGYEIGIAP